MVGVSRYTLFLRFRCGYACGDRETSLFRARPAFDGHTELLVSTASAWEIATKYRLGKLGEAEAVVHGYPDHLARLRARELPISSHHALTAGLLNWAHRDPFDRMIAAQCMLESIPLATADTTLASFPGIRVVW